MKNKTLIYIPKPKPSARCRLVCFAYAGGGLATFLNWQDILPDELELAIVQLPGKGSRLLEEPIDSMPILVDLISTELAKFSDRPLVFFGHSLGASVAYEVIRDFESKGWQLPSLFIASARRAPTLAHSKPPIHALDDRNFKSELSKLGGTPEEILNNDAVMSMVMPGLRADFKIAETYQNPNLAEITSPIALFYGSEDETSLKECQDWLPLFQQNSGIHQFKGGHFFIDETPQIVVKKIEELCVAIV